MVKKNSTVLIFEIYEAAKKIHCISLSIYEMKITEHFSR